MAVYARKDESFDSLFRRFKKDVMKSGVLVDLKKHAYYVSPSQKKRLKHEAAKKKMKRG